jgi:hypothetical protein
MPIDSIVYLRMDTIGADVEGNGDPVVVINDQIDSVNHPKEQVCVLVRVDHNYFSFCYE